MRQQRCPPYHMDEIWGWKARHILRACVPCYFAPAQLHQQLFVCVCRSRRSETISRWICWNPFWLPVVYRAKESTSHTHTYTKYIVSTLRAQPPNTHIRCCASMTAVWPVVLEGGLLASTSCHVLAWQLCPTTTQQGDSTTCATENLTHETWCQSNELQKKI